MYLFDIKTKEKKKKTTNVGNKTLDNKHMEMVTYFRNLQETLPQKKLELESLVSEHKLLIDAMQRPEQVRSDYFLKKKDLEYQIQEKTQEVEKIENKYEENEYYIKVSDILFDYYNIFNPNDLNDDSGEEQKSNGYNSQED